MKQLVIATEHSVPLYPVRMLTVKGAYALLWQLSGKFERNVPGWEHSLLVWRATAKDLAPRCYAAS